MLGKTLGIDFDPDAAWSEKDQVFKASDRIFKTKSISQSAQGKSGYWTTTVAVAVFLFD